MVLLQGIPWIVFDLCKHKKSLLIRHMGTTHIKLITSAVGSSWVRRKEPGYREGLKKCIYSRGEKTSGTRSSEKPNVTYFLLGGRVEKPLVLSQWRHMEGAQFLGRILNCLYLCLCFSHPHTSELERYWNEQIHFFLWLFGTICLYVTFFSV